MSSSSPRRSCHRFSLDVIQGATNKFDESRLLGEGGESKVYLAQLQIDSKKTLVAVKRLNPRYSSNEFENEIQFMSNIQHPHLVTLLGYCKEPDEKILVYEYMKNGSLSKYVKGKTSSKFCLPWLQRLKICLDAARGLQRLHNETEQIPKGIIHRDVKPGNILLGEGWVAKVSDFGMFKPSQAGQTKSSMSTNLKGTRGYLAPEFIWHGRVTRKIDVYAFGMVMFEVLCRKMPWDIHIDGDNHENESFYPTEDEDFGLRALENVDPILASSIKGDMISDKSLKAFTEIIRSCMQTDPTKRPSMNSVVQDLEMLRTWQQESDQSEDEAMRLGAETDPSTCSSQEEWNFVKEDDLEHLLQLIEEKDGGPAWNRIQNMDWSNSYMNYQAWCREADGSGSGSGSGSSWYRFKLVYDDVSPEVMRDFLWDDKFRKSEWDRYLSQAKTLEECGITGAMVVKWQRKFPEYGRRIYIIGRRIWESGQSYYCITKGVPHHSVPHPENLPGHVNSYYSSWRIRPVESRSGNGELSSCEVLLFHHEDTGIPRGDVKYAMWPEAVNNTNGGFKKYLTHIATGQPLSHGAFMAAITTTLTSDLRPIN